LKKLTIAVALALVVAAASGSAFAAHKYLVTSSSQIKPGTISLANLSPTARKALLSSTSTTGPRGPQGLAGVNGAQGPAGPQGATGPAGAAGASGVSGYEVHTWRYSKDDSNSDMGPGYVGVGGGAIATVACSPGKVALSGGYWFTSEHDNGFNSQAVSDGSGVIASFPGRMDWSSNTVKPNDNSGWIVQVNNKVNAADMTLYVVCANAK
jgi:Collagen triple helix repeat (20 copies)